MCALVNTGTPVTVLSEEFYQMLDSLTLLSAPNDDRFGSEPLIMLGKTDDSAPLGIFKSYLMYTCVKI